jgi:hypothetical protein
LPSNTASQKKTKEKTHERKENNEKERKTKTKRKKRKIEKNKNTKIRQPYDVEERDMEGLEGNEIKTRIGGGNRVESGVKELVIGKLDAMKWSRGEGHGRSGGKGFENKDGDGLWVGD